MGVLNQNKESIINSAVRAGAETGNKFITEVLKEKTPEQYREYMDSPVARVVIGNIISAILLALFPKSSIAAKFAEEFVTTPYQEMTRSVGNKLVEKKDGESA